MRILKYILLLLLLFFIGLTVFVITQKGDYDITQSKLIKTPRATVYNYVNDYRNWETFGSWFANDANTQFIYPEKTVGKGASFSWNGTDGQGTITTNFTKENDSITQKMILNDLSSDVFWTFKDSIGKTKVTCRTKGKMTSMMKIKAFLNGGIGNLISDDYEKSLANLDKTLDYELNTFSVKINGVVVRPQNFYVNQTINSKSEKITKNIKILVPKLIKFFEKNNMVIHGKPFVIYNKTDVVNDIVNFSVCVPIKDSVYFSEGSDVSSGKIETMTAVKVTLTGDYAHLKTAKNKALDYIFKNKLVQNFSVKSIEVYVKTVKDIKNPSKWVTEIYIPVYPKFVPKPVYKRVVDTTRTTSSTVTPTVPNTENP